MSNKTRINKNSFLSFGVVFLIIIAIMFISNSKRTSSTPISVPDNAVENIYTSTDKLVIQTPNKKIYLFDWNNTELPPEEININSELSAICRDNKLCAYAPSNQKIIIKDHTGRQTWEHQLQIGFQCQRLEVNEDGNFVIVCNATKENGSVDGYSKFQLGLIDISSENYETIYENTDDSSLYEFKNIRVSAKQKYAAIVGRKNKDDWIAIFDIKSKKMLWEKIFENSNFVGRLDFAVFPKNNKQVYAGLFDYHLYSFDIESSEIINKWSMVLIHHKQPDRLKLCALQESPNGKYLAAGYEPPGMIWVWDLEKPSAKPKKFITENFHVSNIAFSPDSRKIVSGSFKPIDKTLIFTIEK